MRMKPPLVSTVTWPFVAPLPVIAAWIAAAVAVASSVPANAAVVTVVMVPPTLTSSEIVLAAAGDAKADAVKVPMVSASVVEVTLTAP